MNETNENPPEGIEPEASASPNEETQLSPTTVHELIAEFKAEADEGLKRCNEATAKISDPNRMGGARGYGYNE